MKLVEKTTLAIALLAGSTLSLAALAQESSGGSADAQSSSRADHPHRQEAHDDDADSTSRTFNALISSPPVTTTTTVTGLY